jgi:hypothetical protein
MVLGLLLLTIASGMAATTVEVNGNPISFSVAPFQVMNRTMVPMRSIFEALGANVQWNDSTQTVTATRGTTDVRLTIGETDAQVNGQTVALDVPAMMRRGSTMVPLRFVSESLGADVRWSEATQTVSISTNGTPYTYQPTGMQTAVIPQATVIPVSLDTALSSSTSKLGDGFSVTVRSNQDGDAEFPRGTRFVGNVVGLQKADAGQPGMLDLSFREAWLPDGSKATIDGSLISLDDKTVTRSADGRLTATVKPTSGNRLKMIGIGAGAGLLIGKLLDKNVIVGGLLGAAAGYFYDKYTTDKVKPTDVVVKPGTVFGVRMDRDVSYGAPSAFVAARDDYRRASAAGASG